MPVHDRKSSDRLWRACKLQTYFTAKGLIDYFPVVDSPVGATAIQAGGGGEEGISSGPALSEQEKDLFASIRADNINASEDARELAGIVEGGAGTRADRIPWLVRTGFADHLQGLRDVEIMRSYTLPGGAKGQREGGKVSDVQRIVAAAEAYFRDVNALCSDLSPTKKLTAQRARMLTQYSSEAAGGGGTGDRPKLFGGTKNRGSLKKYTRRMTQLLVFYYRVVFCEDGHFTREDDEQALPQDVIKPTEDQINAMDLIVSRLREQDEEEGAQVDGSSTEGGGEDERGDESEGTEEEEEEE
ncbi:hypothetical protein CEP52_017736, partial [Fusarium oligoseptatum]